jgi:hypothetical protein
MYGAPPGMVRKKHTPRPTPHAPLPRPNNTTTPTPHSRTHRTPPHQPRPNTNPTPPDQPRIRGCVIFQPNVPKKVLFRTTVCTVLCPNQNDTNHLTLLPCSFYWPYGMIRSSLGHWHVSCKCGRNNIIKMSHIHQSPVGPGFLVYQPGKIIIGIPKIRNNLTFDTKAKAVIEVSDFKQVLKFLGYVCDFQIAAQNDTTKQGNVKLKIDSK